MPTTATENKYVKYWIEDGYLFSEFKVKEISLKAAKEIVNLRLKITGDKAFYTCVDGPLVKSIDKEARDYMASESAYKNIIAFAAVNSNSIARMISKFYLALKKPPLPTKIVSNKDEAKQWFEELENKKNNANH